MKTIIAGMALVACLAGQARAAVAVGGLTYDVALPTAGTRDYAGGASFRGMGVEARWFRSASTALGFTWHWNVFQEQGDGTWEVENGHVTGHNSRRIRSSPALLTYYYQRGSVDYGAGPLWYAGLGAGAFWMEKRLEVGTGIIQTTNWHAGLCPETGVYYGLSFNALLHLAVRYDYAFKSGESASESYFALTIGIAWAR